jgi:hypothetical protein
VLSELVELVQCVDSHANTDDVDASRIASVHPRSPSALSHHAANGAEPAGCSVVTPVGVAAELALHDTGGAPTSDPSGIARQPLDAHSTSVSLPVSK